ncbi:regulator of G-protein signaling protein-like [Manis javanica]|uniref:regulator of G-protein signaling protein-like n=1 Tax=Manis javanica TaxID=9974 RepID=UPI003C6DA1D1
MSNAEIIGSTNLTILLEDEIFADFFNTFLSLPVFGQTPFYTVENSQWSLWPEIPYDLIAEYKGLLTWLEKYRLPFFCKTNLCMHYILCQELISFIKSPEGGEELVDFWILAEKILSIDEMDPEVRNHYLSLLLMLKATHLQEGSRVVTLCNMNIKSLLNLSIWHPNQSTTRREILSHMQKMALFKLQSYWLPNFYTHAKMIMAKEELCQGLRQEYETRLYSICYSHRGGLPVNMSIKKCHPCQKRYSSRKTKRKMWQLLDHDSWTPERDTKPDPNTMPPPERSPQEKVDIQLPSLKVASSKERTISPLGNDNFCSRMSNMKKKAKSHLHMEGLFERKFSTHLRSATPIINCCPQTTNKHAIKQSLSLRHLHWALCADACAGSPFRDHLKKLNLTMEVQLLDLWQDLYHFLSVLMSNRKTGNAVLRHMLGNRICELHLNEQIGPCLPLKSQIIQGLKELLPSGEVNPWIPRAQAEICKMLSTWYDGFLEEEDYWFLIFTTQTGFISTKWHKREPISREETILLYKRFEESLVLSQGLANMEEMDSMQWQKIATEDLRQGGSLRVELKSPELLTDVEKMSFEELCYKYPKVAIEKMSDDYKTHCEKAPKMDFTVGIKQQQRMTSPTHRKMSFPKRIATRKPLMRPSNLAEVLRNAHHLEFFREFLKERKADGPLQFLVAIQKISGKKNKKTYKSLFEDIVTTFFHGKASPEELLQCDAPIVKEISHMHHVSTTTLLILQDYVMKSLEEKWFKDYQELFPTHPPEGDTAVQISRRKPARTTAIYLQESQPSHSLSQSQPRKPSLLKTCGRRSFGNGPILAWLEPESPTHHRLLNRRKKRVWLKMISVIKSFCKYRRFMSNPSKRLEFEEYLHLEVYNNKENLSTSPAVPGHSTACPAHDQSVDHENGDTVFVKRRIFGHRIITVNFAINDIYFFSEMQKFNNLVSSAHMLQVNRAYNKNDVILMRSKINIILKLYLHSDVLPRLRVNISESQKEAIIAAITEGHLDRSIFHGTIMSLFPIVMYFWKRFCSWKAIHSYLQYRGKKLKDRKSPPTSVNKNSPWSGGDQAILRFSLLRGIEWLQPQPQEVIISPVQNSSSSNLTQSRQALSALQLCPVPGNEMSWCQLP